MSLGLFPAPAFFLVIAAFLLAGSRTPAQKQRFVRATGGMFWAEREE